MAKKTDRRKFIPVDCIECGKTIKPEDKALRFWFTAMYVDEHLPECGPFGDDGYQGTFMGHYEFKICQSCVPKGKADEVIDRIVAQIHAKRVICEVSDSCYT